MTHVQKRWHFRQIWLIHSGVGGTALTQPKLTHTTLLTPCSFQLWRPSRKLRQYAGASLTESSFFLHNNLLVLQCKSRLCLEPVSGIFSPRWKFFAKPNHKRMKICRNCLVNFLSLKPSKLIIFRFVMSLKDSIYP